MSGIDHGLNCVFCTILIFAQSIDNYMSNPTIALLDASIGETPVERNFRREVDAELTRYKASEGKLPAWPAADGSWDFDAAVISGSQTAVYDMESWMISLSELIHDLTELQIPILGVCWGHQFLAHLFGGCVTPMDEYELGYRHIERYQKHPIFDDIPAEFIAFETHSDTVARLPPKATELAGNDRGVQAFAFGTAIGVQFHPEYDIETARSVTKSKRQEGIEDQRVEQVLNSISPGQHERTQKVKSVFNNFLQIVQRNHSVEQTAGI